MAHYSGWEVRWGGPAAIAAGGLFFSYGLLGWAVGKGNEPGPLDLLAVLGYVLQAVGLVGFHALQGTNYGRIGRAGLYTTLGAIALWVLLILASLVGGAGGGLGWLVAVGVLGTLVGLVLYGAATLQARVLPRWCGIAFIVLMPVGILLGDYLPIWSGLVWVALGYALWSHGGGGVSAQRPSSSSSSRPR